MSSFALQTTAPTWQEANHRYVLAGLERLRLLLERRILWLRTQWTHDPLQSYPGLVISEEQADRWLAGPEREAERAFYNQEPHAREVARKLAALDRQLEGERQACHETGSPPALEVLSQTFHLSPFATHVLLLCLAPELDPAFERLYAYVQDDIARKQPTLHLALALWDGDRRAAQEVLTAHTVLRRLPLVSVDQGRGPGTVAGSPLRLAERVRDYVLGFDRIDEAVGHLLRSMRPPLLTAEQESLVEQLRRELEAGAGERGWPAVNLLGAPTSGREDLARALCDSLGLQLFGLNVDGLPQNGVDRHAAFRLLEREALLSRFALYVDAGGDGAPAARFPSLDALEHLGVLVVVGSAERVPLHREALVVRVAGPSPSERRSLWKKALDRVPHLVADKIDDIVEQFDFGPALISRVVTAARNEARLQTGDASAPISGEDLWQSCRDHTVEVLDDLAQRLAPSCTWDDIVLPESILDQLHDIAAQVAQRAIVYESWGFGAKLNRGRGISVLFSGPSGSGKTMAAEILAGQLNLDLYRIDLSGVVSKYIGETEKNLRRVFDAAERTGVILFFDEADALFGKRSEVKDSHDRYANIEVSYLLQRMEDYRGLAILATNTKSHMDQAFLRRLRFLVEFPFPEAAQRRAIWSRVFPAGAPTGALDFAALSRLEITGGNIRNIAVNAAFLASSRGQHIAMDAVFQAARREYAKIGRLIRESEFGPHGAGSK
jgi:hypothetical protein